MNNLNTFQSTTCKLKQNTAANIKTADHRVDKIRVKDSYLILSMESSSDVGCRVGTC